MKEEVMRAGKWICGSIVGFWGLLAPIQVLILCVCIAVIIDFITGNIADYKRYKRAHQKYVFKSEKMWDTCWKLGLSIIGIGMAYMLDVCVLPNLGGLNLANFFAAFVVGTEFWSFLENSAIISNHPIFRALRSYMERSVSKKTQIDFECHEDK